MAFANIAFPSIAEHSYASEDFEGFNKHGINTLKTDSHLTTVVRNNERILVPISLRRSVFWAAHFPADQGLSQTLQILREKKYFWPHMNK